MPFKSDAQRKFMFSQHPDIAKRWAKLTPKGKNLPAELPAKDSSGRNRDHGNPAAKRKLKKKHK